jgi:hypothetical protein
MAQVIQTLCDVHLHSEEEAQVIGRTFVVNINGRIRALELCTECEEQLLVPLQAILTEHARRADATDMPAPAREPRVTGDDNRSVACPVDNKRFKSRAGLSIHARHKHEMSVEALLGEAPNLGMMMCTFPDCGHKSVSRGAVATHALNRHSLTMSELEGEYGPVQPSLNIHNGEASNGELTCPLCSDRRVFKNRAGLGTHADKVHDMTVSMLLGEPNRVKCLHCPREYEDEHAMLDHARKHDVSDAHICMDCNPPQTFVTAAGMNSHRRSKHKGRVAA